MGSTGRITLSIFALFAFWQTVTGARDTTACIGHDLVLTCPGSSLIDVQNGTYVQNYDLSCGDTCCPSDERDCWMLMIDSNPGDLEKYQDNCNNKITCSTMALQGTLDDCGGAQMANYAVLSYICLGVDDTTTTTTTVATTASGFPSSSTTPDGGATSQSTYSPTPRPTIPTTTETSGSSNVGAIVGGVVGGLLLIAIIVVLVLLLMRRRQANQKKPKEECVQANGVQPAPSTSAPKDLEWGSINNFREVRKSYVNPAYSDVTNESDSKLPIKETPATTEHKYENVTGETVDRKSDVTSSQETLASENKYETIDIRPMPEEQTKTKTKQDSTNTKLNTRNKKAKDTSNRNPSASSVKSETNSAASPDSSHVQMKTEAEDNKKSNNENKKSTEEQSKKSTEEQSKKSAEESQKSTAESKQSTAESKKSTDSEDS